MRCSRSASTNSFASGARVNLAACHPGLAHSSAKVCARLAYPGFRALARCMPNCEKYLDADGWLASIGSFMSAVWSVREPGVMATKNDSVHQGRWPGGPLALYRG